MSIKKRMLKNTIIYFIGSAMTLIVSIVFLPIYTKHILTENYGYYELIKSYTELIVPVVCIEIWAGVLKIGTSNDSKDNLKKLFSSTSIFLGLIVSIFIAVVLFLNAFFSIKDAMLFMVSVSC